MPVDLLIRSAVILTLTCPLLLCAWLAVQLALGMRPSERGSVQVASVALGGAWLASLLVVACYLTGGERTLTLAEWFSVDRYAFVASVMVDGLSTPMLLLVTTLGGLIGRFSFRYLHREPGFARFFLLLALFQLGMTLVVLAGSIDLLFVGWELVGLSSVLLIAFFQHRSEPSRNGLWAFCTYRLCDMGLIAGGLLLHHHAHTSSLALVFERMYWAAGNSLLPDSVNTQVSLLLLLAAMGKSAQFPFGAWLPRAMEGPTPSSAIFYGAVSVHAGAYLLLRIAPLLAQSPLASYAILGVGAVTAVQATLAGRVQSDVKSALAFATMSQLGLILVEIGLGWYRLALWHMVGHATLRSFQLLRAPSALSDLRAQLATFGAAPKFGRAYERLLPAPLSERLYGLSLERFHLETLLLSTAAGVMALASALDGIERRWERLLSGWPRAEASHTSASAPLTAKVKP